jgi:hypothetical protein
LRDKPFFGGPSNQSQVRNRERFRLRFNGNVELNDDLDAGFTLASGDLNDPISTNQTTSQFYTRKPFNIDRAFINFHPCYFKPLTLTGGKFVYPWYNTELTWDKDLNPEGVAQTLAFDLESTPVSEANRFGWFRTAIRRSCERLAFEQEHCAERGLRRPVASGLAILRLAET